MAIAYSTSNATAKDGATEAVFTVKRSGTSTDLAGPSSVAFATADVTATAGSDYVATSGSLAFEEGVTEATISVEVLAEAYQSVTSTTFLLSLTGFGAASATIVPDAPSSTTQAYIYIPEDDDTAIVPTADNPSPDGSNNLTYQAVYTGFSDPESSSVEVPLGYIRVGHARADMNDYERVVINSGAYVPQWNGTDDTGKPIEIGALVDRMLPRGISREDLSDQQVQAAMDQNSHLDGVFLYSDKNYIVTVGGDMNQVVQGDLTSYVQGEVRENFMAPATRWSFMGGPDYLRWAEGTDMVNDKYWAYNISACKNLNINGDHNIDYRLGLGFSATGSAEISISNALKYEVANSVGFEVTGLAAKISCNIKGDYEVSVPGFSRTGTEAEFNKETYEKIVLSVNPLMARPRTTTVAAVAATNAVAGLAATTAGWIVDFLPDGRFYQNVNAEEMSTFYNVAFTDAVPLGMASLGAMSAVVVMLAAMIQKAEQMGPAITPKFEMSDSSITLSCGASQITIDPSGIWMEGMIVGGKCATYDFDIAEKMSLLVPEVTATTGKFSVTGAMEVGVDLDVMGDAEVLGQIYGTFVESG